MKKRLLAAALWFTAVWFTYELVWSLADVPRTIGPILGAAIALVIAVDVRRFGLPASQAAGVEPSGKFATGAPTR
jgi:hypothetical protein